MKFFKKLSPYIVGMLLPLFLLTFQISQAAEKRKMLRLKSSKDVLAAIPNHPEVLINISNALFPSTWDISLLGKKATPAIKRALLENTKASIRWQSAQVLAYIRDASARSTLHQALSDWNAKVRYNVLLALQEIGDKTSVPFVIKRLKDPRETLRNKVQAIKTLGNLGDPKAVDVIIDAYEKTARKRNLFLSYAVVTALWKMREVISKARMIRLMRKMLDDPYPDVVRKAIIVLSELKDVGSIDKLSKILAGTSSRLRNVAAYALGQIGSPKAIPVLVQTLQDLRSGRLLNNIIFALQRLKDPKLFQRLRYFLTHRQAFIRFNAAFTTGEMKILEARPLLERALQDPNLIVRNQAIIALGKLRCRKSLPALFKVYRNGRREQRQLAMLAILYISNGQYLRDDLYQMAMGARKRYRRQLAMDLLLYFHDKRVLPLLYKKLSYWMIPDLWDLAKKFHDPYLDKLLWNFIPYKMKVRRLATLKQLFRYFGPEKVKFFKGRMLSTLLNVWYLPYYRQRYKTTLLYPVNPKIKQFYAWGRLDYSGTTKALLRYLGYTGDRKLIPYITPFLYHRQFDIRLEAKLALALLGHKRALGSLTYQLINSSDRFRPKLIPILSALPLRTLIDELQPSLEGKDPYLKLAVAAILVRHLHKKALDVLIHALGERQASIRKRAQFYLLKTPMTPALRKLLWKSVRSLKNPRIVRSLKTILESTKKENPYFLTFSIRKVVMR